MNFSLYSSIFIAISSLVFGQPLFEKHLAFCEYIVYIGVLDVADFNVGAIGGTTPFPNLQDPINGLGVVQFKVYGFLPN
jgi:hypothetical protein